jgi:hypothetical protein
LFVLAALASDAGLLSCSTSSNVKQDGASPAVASAVPARLADYIEPFLLDSLDPAHRDMILRMAENPPSDAAVSACFAEGTPDNVMAAFNSAIFGIGPRFNLATRWGPTAQNPGSTGAIGVPTILTYSFVPDGTPIGAGVGEPAAPSNLFAYMVGIYGTNAAWQAQYHSIFQRWGQLCGITYVYEPNDDGVDLNSAPGVTGVRGDLRLGGHLIDGNSGILAYNYFPQSGDMVIDTGDNFFTNTASNSLRLRNVIVHEHGHGMGLAHVCPITTTKLMEPFVATNYDGPRHDDIRGAQQAYGDIYEPNDTAATARNLGTIAVGTTMVVGTPPAPPIDFGSTISLNINGDQDFFKFSIAAPRLVSITVTPVGLEYEDTEQNCSGNSGSCCTGLFTNSRTMSDINMQLLASNGTTVVASAAAHPAGEAESLDPIALNAAGDYYIRVFSGSTPAQVQLYTVTISVLSETLTVRLPNGAPTLLAPGTPMTFSVVTTPLNQTVTSATLFYRNGAGAFSSVPLAGAGGVNNWNAQLPAFTCGQLPQFYVRATGSAGATAFSPAGAPASFYSAAVGTLTTAFTDNFETDLGWTVSSDAGLLSGAWVRVDPIGTGAQPENDVDAGGTQCFVTGQGVAGGAVGDNDIDGGATALISPTFSLAGTDDAIISYYRWYSNVAGASPAADTMTVEMSSNNGGSWTLVETIGPATENTGGWIYHEFNLSAFPALTRTANMKIRFTASDLGAGSVVEAAVDDVLIRARVCLGGCGSADFNCDGDVGTDADIEAFFACLAGSCPSAPCTSRADFNGDGDTGTDADIEAFFRVLAGGTC